MTDPVKALSAEELVTATTMLKIGLLPFPVRPPGFQEAFEWMQQVLATIAERTRERDEAVRRQGEIDRLWYERHKFRYERWEAAEADNARLRGSVTELINHASMVAAFAIPGTNVRKNIDLAIERAIKALSPTPVGER